LASPGIDTGMGLERLAKVSQKKETVFETDLFSPLIKELEKISKKKYQGNEKIFRIIVDHVRSSVFLIADTVLPSNVEQGYILRRVLRRVIRHGKLLKMPENFLITLAQKIITEYQDIYPELKQNQADIITVIQKEEEKFGIALEKGLKELNEIMEWIKDKNMGGAVGLGGEVPRLDLAKYLNELAQKLFFLYQTYGFPIELSFEEIETRLMTPLFFKDKIEKLFKEKIKEHQEISRKGAEQKFKGGLADHSEKTTKYHTATHLLLAALRQVLEEDVFQKGSNITVERLRFDFSHKEKLTPEQLKKVEDLVNQKIGEDLEVKFEELPLGEARKQGAMGVFGEKYGEIVKVYTIGNFSKEICGGPHVKRTSELGHFKIAKEESSSSGIRRIRAILE